MKKTITSLFESGKSQAEIVRITGIPKSTVSRWINETVKFKDISRLRLRNSDITHKITSRYIPEPNSGCWIWTGNVKKNGYGSITIGGSNFYAHRLMYENFVGKIPPKMVLDHKCRIRCCCNPDHLEVVSPGENLRRTWKWRKKENP